MSGMRAPIPRGDERMSGMRVPIPRGDSRMSGMRAPIPRGDARMSGMRGLGSVRKGLGQDILYTFVEGGWGAVSRSAPLM
jgi:hypothetical protein